MKIELQSDSSTTNSWTDRLGARERTEHIDTRYFWKQERVQDADLRSLQDWYSTDHGSHTPLQDDGDEPMMDLVTGLQTRYRHGDAT